MEFNFPVNTYLKNEITKIGSRLTPDGFYGDRREMQDCVTRMSQIMTVLGENSAKAQGLQKVITSGERLRNTDHTVYILADPVGGSRGTGVVLGMLKIGVKHLYLFDSKGGNHEVYADCILDFYVHESVQRKGFGKRLFEHMLKEENITPEHMAIDKPSPKLLSFLDKHYGLKAIIPQMNNFVVFEGYFKDGYDGERKKKCRVFAAGLSSCGTGSLSSGFGLSENSTPRQAHSTPTSLVQAPPPAPSGRSSAHRPVSTMGLILQNTPPIQRASPTNSRAESKAPTPDPIEQEPEIETIPEPEPEDIEEQNDPEMEQLTIEETEVDGVEEELEAPKIEALPCKVQASAPHLDLKFYHSSLW